MKFFLLLFSLAAIFCANASPLTDEVDKLILRSIPLIGTEDLASEIKADRKPVLLDTRQPEEYQVSHLPGAYWVGFKNFEAQNLPKIEKDSSIIVYCSVGYRSEKIGEKLKAAGYTHVRNLYGGIFAWANEGLALEDREGKTTKTVHGYDRKWAKLLAPEVPKVINHEREPRP
ncbi:MAG: rhodanese-like domain-containing protein [Luteolibacter sp.]